MVSYLVFLVPLLALMLTALAYRRFTNTTVEIRPGYCFPESSVALVEKELKRLIAVHVVLHHIDKPTEDFRSAIIDNLKEGVRYLFYVGKSEYERQSREGGWGTYFDACVQIARSESSALDLGQHITMRSLEDDWSDAPYIFYEYLAMDGKARTERIIAYRGTIKGVGISPSYEAVGRRSAETIARLVGLELAGEAVFAKRNQVKEITRNIEGASQQPAAPQDQPPSHQPPLQ